MKPGDRSRPPTVSAAVGRAAALCDPDARDDVVTAIAERFVDDERPATAVPNLEDKVEAIAHETDPEGPSPAAIMTSKAAAWLATNMERSDDRELVLRESSRAAFHANPPPPVQQWLVDQGI